MWNLKESNKIVGTQDKVNSFKKHLQAMHNIKPKVKLQQPWKPSFSLSKFQNKYHRIHNLEVNKSNQTLMNHLADITNDDKPKTILVIPRTVPSNSETFKLFRRRERERSSQVITRQNSEIFSKIQSKNSPYSKQIYDKQWKQYIKYKNNISKKQYNPDFYQLAKRSFIAQNETNKSFFCNRAQSASNLRPKTALPR